MFDVKKASGDLAFKVDLEDTIMKEKGGTDELGIISVVNHKMESTLVSKHVCVGKKGIIPKKYMLAFTRRVLVKLMRLQLFWLNLRLSMTYTQNNSIKSLKPKARAGKLTNPDNPVYLDEILCPEDVIGIIIQLFPDAMIDGTFDDEDVTKEVVGNYFSLISTKEAKELVLDVYVKQS